MEIAFARHLWKGETNTARNNAKCSKCFLFLCNNSNQHSFFNAFVNIPQVSWKVLKTSFEAWKMLTHEKPCLIPIPTISCLGLLHDIFCQFSTVLLPLTDNCFCSTALAFYSLRWLFFMIFLFIPCHMILVGYYAFTLVISTSFRHLAIFSFTNENS